MTTAPYELLDFGDGRKLERFADYVVDRPSPAADGQPRANAAVWGSAAARFQRGREQEGNWSPTDGLPASWTVDFDPFRLELRPTPFGHLGVFPEQFENWRWIASRVRAARRPLRVLNLFAYTGAATLAAAAVGAEVTHVDAAKNIVAWARQNAELSRLDEAPIRWIVEDVRKFVARELRRGNEYDAVILDPPAYGHGPAGQVWQIQKHLLPLLESCGRLTGKQREFFLVSCHSAGFGPAEIEAALADAVFGSCQAGARARELAIPSIDGRTLPSGVVARWPG